MFNTRLIMVEGIPGSGKSTSAEKIKEYLDSRSIPCRLYQESDFNNPTDFAWISVLKRTEYEKLIEEYKEYEQILKEYTEEDAEYFCICYQAMIDRSGAMFPDDMVDLLRQHEPYDGKFSVQDFCSMHLRRYSRFVQKAAAQRDIYIFESNYLQNQVNELLLFQNLSKDKIVKYLKALAECLKELNPILVYLAQADVYETIHRVAGERLSPDTNLYPHWIDRVIDYVSHSPYGIENSLHGFHGTVDYFKKRKEVELEAIESLSIRTIVIENNDYDVEKGLSKVIEAVSKELEQPV